MQWMVIWMQPYFIKAMEVDWAGWIWLTTGYKTYHYNYDIALAKNHFRLDYTSIWYIYKVFKHITMKWMVICMHPYFIRAMEVGWAGLNLSNKWVKSILLQLWHGWGQNHLRVGYTLPSYIYIKCLSTFWCSGWSSLLHKTMEVWAELLAQSESQTCKFHTTMMWLRPGTTSEWITLPYICT